MGAKNFVGVAGWKEERVYAWILFNGGLQIGAVSMLVAESCIIGYWVRL